MRADAVYASEACSKRARRADSPDKARTEHPLAEVRAEQEQAKEKARWTLIVREHMAKTLLETGYLHADDLDPLGIPEEHRNIAGSQMGGFVQRGLMEEVGRRKSMRPSRKCAKSAIYKITPKGRDTLAGLDTGTSYGGSASVESGEVDTGKAAHPCPRSSPPAQVVASPDKASGALATSAPGAQVSMLPEAPTMLDPDARQAA